MILRFLLIAATRFLVGGSAVWRGTRPSLRQRIYFANHTSNLDTVVLWAALPPELRARTRPVAAADYWSGGLRRRIAIGVLNAVLIDRSGKGAAALDPLHAALAAGDSLVIFPEGGRGPGPLPAPFKSGLYHLARAHPQVEFVPVWLDNIGRALPKGVAIPIPMSARATFGAPVAPAPDEAKDAFLARARDAVIALSGRAEAPAPTTPTDAETAAEAPHA
jgi:1-acyl-sn-glycerol-3-phosphate acyltransferase